MSSTKRGLGGGLSNLFGGDVTDLSAAGAAAGGVTQLSLSRIEPNPNQPRKVFDPNALEELAESIRLHGVITPITVRAGEKSGYYQIIAGERRWRAARMAGLKEIQMCIRDRFSTVCSTVGKGRRYIHCARRLTACNTERI